jgi:hypothetical protein
VTAGGRRRKRAEAGGQLGLAGVSGFRTCEGCGREKADARPREVLRARFGSNAFCDRCAAVLEADEEGVEA